MTTARDSALTGLDSFPYRHRVREVMRTPVSTVRPDTTLADAVARMLDQDVSALIAVDPAGRADGIITEKDVLRALVLHGGDAAVHPVGDYLTRPVAFVRENAFVYMALGRMDRMNIRHLAAIDDRERVVGLVTARGLLKLRAAETLKIGDAIRVAEDAAGLAIAREQLPVLVDNLFAEGLSAVQVAAVISSVYADMTRRAAQVAAAALEADPAFGPAPARWAVLVLGSGGRGESLLAPDQDNAIVHAGTADDDPWFAEVGQRMTTLLDAAGLPFCKGGVMASNRLWRRSLTEWQADLDRWVARPEPENLLRVDIFFDFVPVFGDADLAARLREDAMARASSSPLFLRMMAAQLDDIHPPLGLFGRLRTENGRVDLKRGGLFPLVAGARVMALHQAIPATGTGERLSILLERGILPEADIQPLLAAQEGLARVILRQQVDDLKAGREPGTRVDPKRFSPAERQQVVTAVKQCNRLKQMMQDSLGRVR